MADKTAIEWTDATWNPIGGCSIKSPGCVPCYAQKLAGTRLKNHPLYAGTTTIVKGKRLFNGKLTAAPPDHPVWTWPLRWRGAKAPKLGPGMPSLIFVGDMSDLFHEDRGFWVIDEVVEALVFSRHIGQLLTKRAEVMARYFEDLALTGRWFGFENPLFPGQPGLDPMAALFSDVFCSRLWLGISAERQREFDERWPWLRRLAQMGFTVYVSYEPALGPIVLPDDFLALGRRAQVIAGGTSGTDDPTPMHPDWPRAIRDQCAAAGVPFFFKQWGEWAPHRPVAGGDLGGDIRAGRVRIVHPRGESDIEISRATGDRSTVPRSRYMARVGKSRAGRLLDGVEHTAFPEVRQELRPSRDALSQELANG